MKKAIKIAKIVAIIVCLVIIAYEGIHIYEDQKEYAVAGDEYDQLTNGYVRVAKRAEGEEAVEYPDLEINIEELLRINPDFVGWLYVPSLEISYPIVREKKVDEYLYKTFEGKTNRAGCIFEDIESDPFFCGRSDMIFGHNMKNKTMFGSLKQLYQNKDEDLVAKSPYVYIYTMDYVFEYQIYSYHLTTRGSEAYSIITSDEEYDDYVTYTLTHNSYANARSFT